MINRYGETKLETCYFCSHKSTSYNSQGIPVCLAHRNKELTDVYCACGISLDGRIQKGKYGPFFICPNCGCLSLKKIKELSEPIKATYKINGALKH